MRPLPQAYLDLAATYEAHGFSLYLIGGTSRDYLLGIEPADLDFVTDATPEEEKGFLTDADFSFERFGSVKVRLPGTHADVTTLRTESGYLDSRHPNHIAFVKDLRVDSLRRDFTINAIYIDKEGRVYDYHHGLDDLQSKTIRFIGDPYVRVKEDPLRIIRAERFARRLGFTVEPLSQKAMDDLRDELLKINPDKVSMEKKKG